MPESLAYELHEKLCIDLVNDKSDKKCLKLAGYIMSGKTPFKEFLRIARTVTELNLYGEDYTASFEHPAVTDFGSRKIRKRDFVLHFLFKYARTINMESEQIGYAAVTTFHYFHNCNHLQHFNFMQPANIFLDMHDTRYLPDEENFLKTLENKHVVGMVKMINVVSPFTPIQTQKDLLFATGFIHFHPRNIEEMIVTIKDEIHFPAFIHLQIIEPTEVRLKMDVKFLGEFFSIRSATKNIVKLTLKLNSKFDSVEECAQFISETVTKMLAKFPTIQEIVIRPGVLTFTKLLRLNPTTCFIEPNLRELQEPAAEIQKFFENHDHNCPITVNLKLQYHLVTGKDDSLFERHVIGLRDVVNDQLGVSFPKMDRYSFSQSLDVNQNLSLNVKILILKAFLE